MSINIDDNYQNSHLYKINVYYSITLIIDNFKIREQETACSFLPKQFHGN